MYKIIIAKLTRTIFIWRLGTERVVALWQQFTRVFQKVCNSKNNVILDQ